MERGSSHQTIQGGGSGEGFSVPEHVLRECADEIDQRLHRMRVHAHRAVHNRDAFDRQGNHDAEIWMQSLEVRVAQCHDAVVRRTSFRGQDASAVQYSPHHPLPDAIRPSHLPRITRNLTVGPSSTTLHGQHSQTPASTNPRISVPMRKHIPRITKSASEMVFIWLNGSEDGAFRPVKQFETAEMRSVIIPNYSDAEWSASGQKRAFQRFKRIISEIAKHNKELLSIYSTNQRLWDKAIERFNEKWTCNGKVRALSVIEKMI